MIEIEETFSDRSKFHHQLRFFAFLQREDHRTKRPIRNIVEAIVYFFVQPKTKVAKKHLQRS